MTSRVRGAAALWRVCLVASLAVNCGPAAAPSPWGRKLSKSERQHWPTRCGVPVSQVETLGAQTNRVTYTGTVHARSVPTVTACTITWDERRDDLSYLAISIAAGLAELPDETIDRFLVLGMDVLRPQDQQAIRAVAKQPGVREVNLDGLVVLVGRDTTAESWSLEIRVRP